MRRRQLLQGRCPSVGERAPPQSTLPPRKPSGLGPVLSRWTSARGGATSSEGCVVKATTTSPNPNHQRVTEAPKQPEVTATRKMAKSKPKPTTARKPVTVKHKTKSAASIKTVDDKPTTNLVVSTQPTTSPLEDISDLNNLLQTCEADSSAAHIHLFRPHRGSPPVGSPEYCHPFCC